MHVALHTTTTLYQVTSYNITPQMLNGLCYHVGYCQKAVKGSARSILETLPKPP